jgi:hypothetical protein
MREIEALDGMLRRLNHRLPEPATRKRRVRPARARPKEARQHFDLGTA